MSPVQLHFKKEGEPPKRALICGISGQDGAYLAEFLLSKGYEVFGTSRDVETNDFQNLFKLNVISRVRLIPMMPSEIGSTLEVLRMTAPDEIYNLSGQSSVGLSFERPQETLDSIVGPTKNILEAIRLLKPSIRFFSAGSGECFGGSIHGIPCDETTPFNPRSPYAEAKVQAHLLVQTYREKHGLFACTGILFNHESRLRPIKFVTQKIIQAALNSSNALRDGRKLEKLHLGNLSIRRDWGWAPEYVKAMWLMLQKYEPEDFIIATGITHSLEDFVETTFTSVGCRWKDHVLIDSSLFRANEPLDCSANPKKAKSYLGWEATVHLEGVVRRMLALGVR